MKLITSRGKISVGGLGNFPHISLRWVGEEELEDILKHISEGVPLLPIQSEVTYGQQVLVSKMQPYGEFGDSGCRSSRSQYRILWRTAFDDGQHIGDHHCHMQ